MNTRISFTDVDGDQAEFSPSLNEGDLYITTATKSHTVENGEQHIVRLEPAQIEALVDYLLDVLAETVDAPKWDGYIEASVEA